MSGNVWEWCADWFGSYPSGAQTNPTGPTNGTSRVLRGGSWLSLIYPCRVADRGLNYPGYRSYHDGFRLLKDVK